ncbi:MAG: hypothetical protein ACYTJ0_14420 [Planctomycetota bacterium]|jgi:hypothetical protein
MLRTTCLVATLTLITPAALADDPPAEVRWWKGNTHTHTYWSDGDAAPEHVADWYVRNGYHFLVLSDHNVLSRGEKWFPISEEGGRPLRQAHVEDLERRFGPGWVETRERDGQAEMRLKTLEEVRARFERDGRFLFVEGEEITDSFRRLQVHINGLNLAEAIAPQGGESLQETIQRNIDAVIEHGRRFDRPVLAHVNHPNFQHSLSPEDIAAIEGERFFEVYNGHRSVLNYGDERSVGMEELWDRALTLRLVDRDGAPEQRLLYGLATDDAHDHRGTGEVSVPGRGWVWVRAPRLTPESIIGAMRRGDFYASTGVELEQVARTDGVLAITIRPQAGVTYRTEFIGTRLRDGSVESVGQTLATSTSLQPRYEMRGDELYVRARITSSRPHPRPFAEGDRETAWVQPVAGPAAP